MKEEKERRRRGGLHKHAPTRLSGGKVWDVWSINDASCIIYSVFMFYDLSQSIFGLLRSRIFACHLQSNERAILRRLSSNNCDMHSLEILTSALTKLE